MRFAANEQTIPKLHLIATLVVVALLAVCLGGYFSWRSAADYRASIARLSHAITAQQHARLAAELEAFKGELQHTAVRNDLALRRTLRERVETALQVAQSIHERESTRHPPEVVKRLIIDALRPVRFSDGRSHYFIHEMTGRVVLQPDAPAREGTSDLDLQDDHGHFIMRSLINAAGKADDDGYSRLRWYSPDQPFLMADMKTYVRPFKPYGWMIGTGDYLYKWEEARKADVLARLRTLRFGETGYFGVIDAAGRLLLSPSATHFEGLSYKSLPKTPQAALATIVDKARQGGGYVHYDWPELGTGEISGQTGLVTTIESWGWTVLSTMQDNELQLNLQQELARHEGDRVQQWLHWLLPLGLALLVGVLVSLAFARWLRRLFVQYHQEMAAKTKAVADSEALFHAVFSNVGIGIAQASLAGKFLQVNPHFCSFLGYTADELLTPPNDFRQVTFADDILADEQRIAQLLQGQGDSFDMEKRYLCKNGGVVWGYLSVHLVRDQDGAPDYFIAAVHDITERKRGEQNLLLAASVFTHAREGIFITDADGIILDVNESFIRITGYGREEAVGQNPRLLKSGVQTHEHYVAMWEKIERDDHWYGETWNRRKNGQLYVEMQTISAVRNAQNQVSHYVSLFSDITAVKEHESQLQRIAHFDPLTNLPNRVLLADRLQQAMAQALRREQFVAVIYLDLDGFKSINDAFGHDAGDRVLIGVATRMKDILRDGDTLARIGGDEFVAVLVDLPHASACLPLLNRLLQAAAEPMLHEGKPMQVSASMGVTYYPQAEGIDAEQLQRQADQSMYQAKLLGKNRFHVFDAEQDRTVRGQHDSLERVRQAFLGRELVLYYQPKVDMRAGLVIGVEALIRWQHPERGLLAPSHFLPAIESHALAVEIGEWVIDTALNQVQDWHAQGLDLPVSVNIGARQLQQHDFVSRLRTLLDAYPDLLRHSLELEVLETSALEDINGVSQTLSACRTMGVHVALDDFGTGYSSLTYLKRLPVDALKIDQSFVRDMLEDADDLAILQGVIGLATAFHHSVIAEGVETVAHGTALLALGCKLGQGYGIAHPMPASEVAAWVATWKPDPAWQGQRVGG